MYRKTISVWRYPLTLLALYGLLWIALAIAPVYRQDWLLENLIVFIAIPILVLTARRLRFSKLAYTGLFVFFSLHAIGAHYTYSLVPYDQGFQALTGGSLNELLGFGRNHYDRLMHFLYGLLVTPAAVEIFAHYGRYPRSWAALFPFLFMASHAVIYELVEYAAALVFGGDLGQAYLGTQGDVWDGQKDMALALAGSAISIIVTAIAGRLPIRRT
jgi:putative membrane protein